MLRMLSLEVESEKRRRDAKAAAQGVPAGDSQDKDAPPRNSKLNRNDDDEADGELQDAMFDKGNDNQNEDTTPPTGNCQPSGDRTRRMACAHVHSVGRLGTPAFLPTRQTSPAKSPP